MQVEPQTPLPAVYQIVDHTDPNRDAYYVRAVVRDSLTAATLATVNLLSKGEGRYASVFPAPADGTGLGRQIDVTITVYTDTGYSLKSELYQQIIEKWYVKTAAVSYGGGSGGDGTDYDYIVKSVDKLLVKRLKEIKDALPESVDLEGVSRAIAQLEQKIDGIDIPEPERISFDMVLEAINKEGEATRAKVDSIEKPEALDYERLEAGSTPITDAIRDMGEQFAQAFGGLSEQQRNDIPALVEKVIRDLFKDRMAKNTKLQDALKAIIDESDIEPAAEVPKEPTAFSKFTK